MKYWLRKHGRDWIISVRGVPIFFSFATWMEARRALLLTIQKNHDSFVKSVQK